MKSIKEKEIKPNTDISIKSQQKLIKLMNNSPSIAKLAGTEWAITALKPAVQWMIVEEACSIQEKEDASAKDIYLGIASNFHSVIKIITLALLNDKKKIEKDYDTIYELLKWESEIKDWALLLQEVLGLLDVSFFFATTDVIQMMRAMTTQRKITMQEQKQLLQERNGDR